MSLSKFIGMLQYQNVCAFRRQLDQFFCLSFFFVRQHRPQNRADAQCGRSITALAKLPRTRLTFSRTSFPLGNARSNFVLGCVVGISTWARGTCSASRATSTSRHDVCSEMFSAQPPMISRSTVSTCTDKCRRNTTGSSRADREAAATGAATRRKGGDQTGN